MKHTRGPWHTGGFQNRIIYAADGFAVADATVFHGRHEGEHTGNAALIAAAPDLLDALARLEFAAQCRDITMGDPCRLIEVKAELAAAAEHARSVIKQATGG